MPSVIVAVEAIRGVGASVPIAPLRSVIRACFALAIARSAAWFCVTIARCNDSDVASWLTCTRKFDRKVPKAEAPTWAPPVRAVVFCCQLLLLAFRSSVTATAMMTAAVAAKSTTAYRTTGIRVDRPS